MNVFFAGLIKLALGRLMGQWQASNLKEIDLKFSTKRALSSRRVTNIL